MQRETKTLSNIDWITVILYTILIFFGWINIYAANYNPELTKFWDFSREHTKQIIWIALSAVLIWMIFMTDSKFYVAFAYPFYGITLFLLITVLLFGTEVNGAKSWFELGPIRFQPAELTKVATNLALARMMSRFSFKITKIKYLFRLLVIWIIPILLILLQNDTGSALVYLVFILVWYREGLTGYILLFGITAVFLAISTLLYSNIAILVFLIVGHFAFVYYKGGKKEVYLASAILAGTTIVGWMLFYLLKRPVIWELFLAIGMIPVTIIFLYRTYSKRMKFLGGAIIVVWAFMSFGFTFDYFFNNVLTDYQQTRINVLLGLKEDPLGAGYNVNQSKITIGSGGVAGKGFLQGTQTKYDFVPEQSTDFIFCTVGEEWGFLGTTIVVGLFLTLLLRLLFLAERQHSDFSRIYGYGVATIFFFHFTINIGMTIGLAPVIGIPLPFFSYGGSSLWGFTLLLFIFLKLDTNRAELIR